MIEILRVVPAASTGPATLSGSATALSLDRLIRQICQVLFGKPAAGCLELRGNIAHSCDHDQLAADLPAELFEVLIVIDDSRDNIRAYSAVCPRCPGFGIRNELETRVGRDRSCVELFIGPTATERSPRFQIHVRKLPFHELLLRPFRCGLDLRRAGKARSINIGEIAQRFHHLRSIKTLILDSVYRVEIWPL